jgi:hypothetical protein
MHPQPEEPRAIEDNSCGERSRTLWGVHVSQTLLRVLVAFFPAALGFLRATTPFFFFFDLVAAFTGDTDSGLDCFALRW